MAPKRVGTQNGQISLTRTISLAVSSRIGYARVSTPEQNLDTQVDILKNTGCSVIRCETKGEAKLKDSCDLQSILDFIRAGDTLAVTRIGRLARFIADVQAIVNTLRDKGVFLLALYQPVDTSDAGGKAFFDMLTVLQSLRVAFAVSGKPKAFILLGKEAFTKSGGQNSIKTKSSSVFCTVKAPCTSPEP